MSTQQTTRDIREGSVCGCPWRLPTLRNWISANLKLTNQSIILSRLDITQYSPLRSGALHLVSLLALGFCFHWGRSTLHCHPRATFYGGRPIISSTGCLECNGKIMLLMNDMREKAVGHQEKSRSLFTYGAFLALFLILQWKLIRFFGRLLVTRVP